jgi:O-glycosyl hydrolase
MSGVTNVAFKNPDGKITVLFHNTSSKKVSFAVKVKPCQNTLQVEVPENSATSVIF